MRLSTRILLNASINLISSLVNTLVALFVVRIAVDGLGKEVYGVYAVVAGLTLYTPYLHMGMASAVARYTAAHLAKGQYDEMNAVVNTGVAYYRAMAVVFFAIMAVIALYCVAWFVEDPSLHRVARWCVMVLAVFEGLVMVIGPVPGILTAIERFDLYRLPVTFFRIVRLAALAVILPFCDPKTGVIVFTAVMAGTNFLPVLTHRLLVSRYTPNLKFDMRLARRNLVVPLIKFGIGSISWSWSQMMLTYLPILLIGAFLTTAEVTDYEVPGRILMLIQALAQDVMMVMMPAASKLTATERRDELRTLAVRSAKYAGGVSVAGCGFLAILSAPVLYVWVGEGFLDVAIVLSLLAIGRACISQQSSSQYILIGMARQRIPAIITVTTVVVMGICQALCLHFTDWGLVGVTAIATGSVVLGWGIGIPAYACRQVSVSFRRYMATSVVRPVLACLPAGAAWVALRFLPVDQSWIALGGGVASGAVLIGLGWWFILFDEWDRDLMREKLQVALNKLRSGR